MGLDQNKGNFTLLKWLSRLSPKGLDVLSLKGYDTFWSGEYKHAGTSELLSVKTLETSAAVCVNTSLLRCIKAEKIIVAEDQTLADYTQADYVSLLFVYFACLSILSRKMFGFMQ